MEMLPQAGISEPVLEILTQVRRFPLATNLPACDKVESDKLYQASTTRGGQLLSVTRDNASKQIDTRILSLGPVLPGGVALLEGPGRHGESELLYVLVNGSPQTNAARIVESLTDEFSVSGRTVSARLIDAIQLANRRVSNENRRSMTAERSNPDLGVVLLRGNEAIVSLAGRARVYVVRDGELFDVAVDASCPALGEEEPSVPLMVRLDVRGNDTILLAGDELLDHVPAERVAAWFAEGVGEGASWLEAALRNRVPLIAFQPGARLKGPRSDRRLHFGRTFESFLRDLPVRETHGVARSAGRIVLAGINAAVGVAKLFLPAGEHGTAIVVEQVIARPQAKRVPARPLTVAVGLASAIGLIALGAGVSAALGSDRIEQTYITAVADAERSQAAAHASTDPVFARARLKEADLALQRALSVKKDDRAARTLVESVRGDLAKLDRVVAVPGIQQVADLASLGAQNPSGLVIVDGNAYVLDDSGWGVRKLATDPNKPAEPQLILGKGAKSDDSTVGDPLAIAFMGQSENRPPVGLLTLDRQRELFVMPASKVLQSLAVRGASGWSNPLAIRGYAGNLYVLDPPSNQVWRYSPTWNGYDSEMKGLLQGASIEDARDFALDGDVYVVTGSGKVWKFSAGIGKEFDLRTLDRPLDKPGAIVTGATARNVYVADSGNNRIVVFDKEGRFQRQLTDPAMTNIRAFSVDEALGRLYFIAGKKLFRAPLPK